MRFRRPFSSSRGPQPFGVITLAVMQDVGVLHVFEKRVCSGAVGNLPTSEQEGDGPAESIGQGVDLRGVTAPRATSRLRPLSGRERPACGINFLKWSQMLTRILSWRGDTHYDAVAEGSVHSVTRSQCRDGFVVIQN